MRNRLSTGGSNITITGNTHPFPFFHIQPRLRPLPLKPNILTSGKLNSTTLTSLNTSKPRHGLQPNTLLAPRTFTNLPPSYGADTGTKRPNHPAPNFLQHLAIAFNIKLGPSFSTWHPHLLSDIKHHDSYAAIAIHLMTSMHCIEWPCKHRNRTAHSLSAKYAK